MLLLPLFLIVHRHGWTNRKIDCLHLQKLLLPPSPSIVFNHSTIKLAGNVHWTKTGTTSALIECLEPSNAIGIHTENVCASFETIAGEMNGEKMNQKILETMNDKIGIKTKNVPCGIKSSCHLIANTKVIDATVITAVTKSDGNGMSKTKLMWSNGRIKSIGSVIDKEGKYGLTQFAYGIVDKEKNLENIKKSFDSHKFRRLMEYCAVGQLTVNYKIISLFKKDFWKEFI